MITRNTVVGISVGSVFTLLAGMWLAVAEVQGWVGKIEDNTDAIAALSSDVKISRVYDMISDLRSERRDLRRIQETRPDDPIVIDQLEEIDDEIEMLDKVLDCLMEGGENCARDG